MRITTGIYKGRNLASPKGIRPTQNKVRKAVFDILGDIEGLSFLELFAGSAAVGLEAKSRGASSIVFVENQRECVQVIRKNLEMLKAAGCRIITLSVEKAVEALFNDKKSFDIIFIDPPYYKDIPKKTLQIINAYDILAPNGIMVVQHYSKDDLPDNLGVLSLLKRSKYGDTVLSFYRKA
ncbi:MAG: 16S rRNA (guanine(966)-N(2))-methyltransferase RsmD [Candidatus Omnitrophica bacterium]|nr:16S rRNA (guanine(966)-N(2))-methyltransferase RsmD [Candidatus Omnitrophota bacterium]